MPGFYRLAKAPRCWKVPARIGLENGLYTAEIDGEAIDGSWSEDDIEWQLFEWLTHAGSYPFFHLVLFGRPSTGAEFKWLLALKDWAAIHNPNHPCLHPLRSMDPLTLKADDF